MSNRKEQEEITQPRLLIGQLEVTTRRVIRELGEINRRLRKSENTTTVVAKVRLTK